MGRGYGTAEALVPAVAIERIAQNLAAEARMARQRRLLWIGGSPAWCYEMAERTLDALRCRDPLWISHSPRPGALSYTEARGLLGSEAGAIVFDAHGGFDVEALAAVGGVIRGGGLLLLLTPSLPEWEQWADPENRRVAVYPWAPAEVGNLFLRRLRHLVTDYPGIALFDEQLGVAGDGVTGVSGPLNRPEGGEAQRLTEGERRAIEAIVEVAAAPTPVPLLILSDRGRGKSSSLGIAAARLVRESARIVVTAPSFAAAATLFEQACRALPGARRGRSVITLDRGAITFSPPDALIAGQAPQADLLLVDEAAAIPLPLLERLTDLYARIVFATTVHGYEGSGRGFTTRFQSLLRRRRGGYREVWLDEPVRWARDDPLEALLFSVLLFDACAAPAAAVEDATPERCEFQWLERDSLAMDESLLRELFGLLVEAHYRTSPLDLRHLLDGPNLGVGALLFEGRVVAALMMAREGGLDATLAAQVSEGARRVRGHLLPQSLAFHLALPEAATLASARIVRVAVHPAVRGRGLGRWIIGKAMESAARQGSDLFGASFGVEPALLRFWNGLGLVAVRLGTTRETSSGTPSVMVLRSLTPSGSSVVTRARRRFLQDLPHLLAEPGHQLEGELVATLRQGEGGTRNEEGSAEDLMFLAGFAAGRYDYGLLLGPLGRWAGVILANADRLALSEQERTVLALKVLERCRWDETVERLGVQGRGAATAILRSAVGKGLPLLRGRRGAH